MYWKNGDRYEGDWKNDIREGKGIYYSKSGNIEIGEYLNGESIGMHVRIYNNGKVSEIKY